MRLCLTSPLNSGQWATRGPEASLGHATIAGNVHVETCWRLETAPLNPGRSHIKIGNFSS